MTLSRQGRQHQANARQNDQVVCAASVSGRVAPKYTHASPSFGGERADQPGWGREYGDLPLLPAVRPLLRAQDCCVLAPGAMSPCWQVDRGARIRILGE